MRCQNCNGTGKERKGFYEKTGINKWEMVWDDVLCEECDGTGEIEVTNEEWFTGLTTKEKALTISQLTSAYGGNVYELEEWLKEKHLE